MIDSKTNIEVSALGLFEELKKEKKRLISSKTILDKKDNHEYPITDVPFKIPSNWVWCYLSDISLIQEGPGIRKHQYSTSGVQFLTVTNILEGSVDLEKSKKYISKEQYKNYSHFTINNGDIVTACSGGSWGKSAIYDLDEKLILNTSTLRLRFYNDLGDNYYLYYLTKTKYFKDSLSKYITGQQPNYGYSHYSKIPIPLPSLPEQQRIVAILDEAFAAIAKAKANAEQNLKNAKELFEGYLQGVFENKEGEWEEKKLGQIILLISGQHIDSKEYNIEHKGIGYLTGPSDFGLLYPTVSKWTEFPKKNSIKGDLLITVKGSGVGKINLMKDNELCISRQLMAIRPINIDGSFLYSFLSTKFSYFQSLSNGAAIPGISREDVLNLKIPFPNIDEQQIIVKKLDALYTETKKLEAIYYQKINDLEELKKSVLQKAFSGELKTVTALV